MGFLDRGRAVGDLLSAGSGKLLVNVGFLGRGRAVGDPAGAGPETDPRDRSLLHLGLQAPTGGGDGLSPARRDEAGGEVSEGGEDEEAPPGLGVGDDEPGSFPARGSPQRAGPFGGGRPGREIEPMAPEDEDVEVDLAGPPPSPRPTTEGPLDGLAPLEERKGGLSGITHDPDVDGSDGVEEVGLVPGSDGPRPIEGRNRPDREAGCGGEGPDGGDEPTFAVAEVRSQTEVGPNQPTERVGAAAAPMTYSGGMTKPTADALAGDSAPSSSRSRPEGVSLAERLRASIEAEGPIPFARFMEIALTDPDGGYYTAPEARPTRGGDYLTAPELHPIFGHGLARQVQEVWERLGRPAPFTVREYGAGGGALAAAIIEEIGRAAPRLADVLRYEPVELNPHRRAELRERFASMGFADALGEPGDVIAHGVVLANEYVDALPVHRLVLRGQGLRERYVAWVEGRFAEVEGPPSEPEVEAAFRRLGLALRDVVVEVRPAARRWLKEVAESLRIGVAIIIDYGGSRAELYGSHHPEGTVLAYRGHRVVDDPLAKPGEQDLTAHVDFDDLASAAGEVGLQVLGITSQAAFLVGCGLEELLRRAQADPASTLQGLLELRSAVRRLLDPRALGGFRVAVFGRGLALEPPLRGLAAVVPTRTPVPRPP